MSPPDAGRRLSLGTAAARTLATTTKTPPQTREISPRWLPRILPWVEVPGGMFRVNRRNMHVTPGGRVGLDFDGSDAAPRPRPETLTELPPLRGLDDGGVLEALAGRFTRRDYEPGGVITVAGEPMDRLVLLAHGRARAHRAGPYDDAVVVGRLTGGDHVGAESLAWPTGRWPVTVTAVTSCTVLTLPAAAFAAVADRAPMLRAHLARHRARVRLPRNRRGEALISISAGHTGEHPLPGAFADYDPAPRMYEPGVTQTRLRVHSRVADLYNEPMDQGDEQLRLTVEAIRERQEHELLNNRVSGLLHNADPTQRLHTKAGPPTPDDVDELLSRRRSTHAFLAHPRAIAAFGHECSRRHVTLEVTDIDGRAIPVWRGVPIYPCDKIPISSYRTTRILAMRLGERHEGVVGLRPTGLSGEHSEGLSVRRMGLEGHAIASYLVSAYHSAAVLTPSALGVLEGVQLGGAGGAPRTSAGTRPPRGGPAR